MRKSRSSFVERAARWRSPSKCTHAHATRASVDVCLHRTMPLCRTSSGVCAVTTHKTATFFLTSAFTSYTTQDALLALPKQRHLKAYPGKDKHSATHCHCPNTHIAGPLVVPVENTTLLDPCSTGITQSLNGCTLWAANVIDPRTGQLRTAVAHLYPADGWTVCEQEEALDKSGVVIQGHCATKISGPSW